MVQFPALLMVIVTPSGLTHVPWVFGALELLVVLFTLTETEVVDVLPDESVARAVSWTAATGSRRC